VNRRNQFSRIALKPWPGELSPCCTCLTQLTLKPWPSGLPSRRARICLAESKNRVSSLRRVHGIRAYRCAEKNGEWLTISEAAAKVDVTNDRIRRFIKDRVLAAEHVVPGAPY
jgi:hypothetical protein